MKTNLATTFRAALLGALLLAATAPVSHAAPKWPVFTNGYPAWDCLITGSKGERGILFITFTTNLNVYGNYTFNLRQIHTKIPVSAPKIRITTTNAPDGRGGTTSGRGDSDSGTDTLTNLLSVSGSASGTNIYGYMESTNGAWGFDYKGNVLGVYYETVQFGTGTNATMVTNQVSFIGKVTPNKRFTALFYSSIGGLGKYSGVPLKNVTKRINGDPDLGGQWTGSEISGALNTIELYTMTNGGFTNYYTILGDGPGYVDVGKCLVSSQKKIAFSNDKLPIEDSHRATYGDLINSIKVLGAKTKGLMQPGSNVVYNTYFLPPVTPP